MTDKNMVDVADKAVDKLAAGVEAVAKAVEKVAPHVWEILCRQAFAEGVVCLVTAAILTIVLVIAGRLAWKRIRWTEDLIDALPLLIFPVLGYAALAGVAITELREGVLKVSAPEYYAAKQLIEAAK